MPSTPIYALPYPAATDPADVPTDMQELADRIETILTATLAYTEITAQAVISSTAEATPTAVISGPALTFDGSTRIRIAFYAPYLTTPTTNGHYTALNLWDGATNLGRISMGKNAGTVDAWMPVYAERRLTPSAGSHTYKVQGWVSTGSGSVMAGTGGAGFPLPAFLRVERDF